MATAETQTDAELDGLLNRLVSLADEAGSAGRAKGRPSRRPICSSIRSLLRDEELTLAANGGSAEQEPGVKAGGGFFPSRPHARRGATSVKARSKPSSCGCSRCGER